MIKRAKLLALFFFLFSFTYIYGEKEALTLDESCVVNVLNRSVSVDSSGKFGLSNVPSFMGRVRGRVSCLREGETISGETDFFSVLNNDAIDVGTFFNEGASSTPKKLQISGIRSPFSLFGRDQQVQLSVFEVFEDNSKEDVTNSEGINYRSSNPSIVSVGESSGLLKSVKPGTVLISIRKDGVLAVLEVEVFSIDDADEDGVPDDYEIVHGLNPNDPFDASEDQDKDGLSALEEFELGLDPNEPDTDKDGIEDGEETVAGDDGFITDPILADTDGDLLNDGLEILIGSSPVDETSGELAKALDSISVTPEKPVLIFNSIATEVSENLQVTGQLIDGTTIDLTQKTSGTSYSSSNLAIISFGATDGEIFGGQVGFARIEVVNNDFKASVNVEVRNFTPTALSAIVIPGYANNVDVAGNYAFVASGENGLTVVDVTDKVNPFIAATLDTSGTSIDIKIIGNLALIADGESGLQVIDITDPINPLLLSTYDTAGIAQDLVVDFNSVYIANGTGGIEIIDISDPVNPYGLSSLFGLGEARGLDVELDRLVVVAGSALHVIDVADRAAPSVLGSVSLSNAIKDVVLSGNFAYVAAHNFGYRIVDISTPSAPSSVSGGRGFIPRDLAISDGLAIFAEQLFPNVAAYVNIQDPANSIFQGTIDLSSFGDYAGTGIALDNSYSYVTEEAYAVTENYKATGDTKLFIAQYRVAKDSRGVAPTITLQTPSQSTFLVAGVSTLIEVSAEDDIGVKSVTFNVNGEDIYRDTVAPFQLPFVIPESGDSLNIEVTATDFGGNINTTGAISFAVLADSDSDGLYDSEEVNIYNTDPEDNDSDNDGIPDGREVVIGINPNDTDSDDDGIDDGDELFAGTDPLNSDVSPPVVLSSMPENDGKDISESTSIEVTFSEDLKKRSITEGVLELKEFGATSVVASGKLLLSQNQRSLIFQPGSLLKENTKYQINVTGVKDIAGNQLVGPFISTFTTSNFVDTASPNILRSNPSNGVSNSPTAGIVTVEFDEPIKSDSLTDDNVYLYDTMLESTVPGSYLLSQNRRILTFMSDIPLGVGRDHYLSLNGITDLYSNSLSQQKIYFKTNFVPDETSPEAIGFSLPEGLSDVPTNVVLEIAFNEALNPLKLEGVKLFSKGQEVSIKERSLSNNQQSVVLTQWQPLDVEADYTLRVEGIEDTAGNQLQEAIEWVFTTGSEASLTAATLEATAPLNSTSSSVPINSLISLRFSESLSQLVGLGLKGQYQLYNKTLKRDEKFTIALSPDGSLLSFSAVNGLQAMSEYLVKVEDLVDLVGNNVRANFIFKTSSTSDSTPVALFNAHVAGDLVDMPLNSQLWYRFDEQISLDCLESARFLLKDTESGRVSGGKLSLSSDQMAVRFVPDEVLVALTPYNLSMSGICDVAGNVMDATSLDFTTSGVVTDYTGPRLIEASPVAGTTDASVDAASTLTFSEAISVANLNVIEVSANGAPVLGSVTMSTNQTQITFTPDSPYPAGATIRVYGNSYNLQDFAGNRFYSSIDYSFTAEANNADTKVPVVVSITPNDNAVDLSPSSRVVLTFSEPLDPATINSGTLALFGNGDHLEAVISRSQDNQSITLSANLPGNSVIAVVATGGIKDLSGNALNDYVSLFTTGSSLDNQRPSIASFKPGDGSREVEADQHIFLYSDEAINANTLTEDGALYVSQNGQLIAGGLSLTDAGRLIRFIPDQPFEAGSFIQVFVSNRIQDVSGNALLGYEGGFQVKASQAAGEEVDEFTVVGLSSQSDLPLNAKFYYRFSNEVDPASLNAISVRGAIDEEGYYSGALPHKITLSQDGKTLILSSDDLWKPYGGRVFVNVDGITDIAGNKLDDGNGWEWEKSFYFQENPVEDNVKPLVTLFNPESDSGNVAINTRVIIQFNESINPLSFDSGAVFGEGRGTLDISDDNKTYIYTYHNPLLPNTKVDITLAGFEDYAGNEVLETVKSFSTSENLDLKAPEVISISPEGGRQDVAINSVVRIDFDEVINPMLVKRAWLFDQTTYQTVLTDISYSADGRSLIMIPKSMLAVGRSYSYHYLVEDLVGNHGGSSEQYFTTSFIPDEASPEVTGFSVPEDLSNVPTNAVLQVAFNEPINPEKLEGVKLLSGGEEVELKSRVLSASQQMVELRISQPLVAQTAYSFQVDGVEDRAGNALSAAIYQSFSTGAGVDLETVSLRVATPLRYSTVPINTEITFRFNKRINPLITHGEVGSYSLYNSDFRSVPLSVVLSADGLVLSIIPETGLQINNDYSIYLDGLTDLVGNIIPYQYWRFSTSSSSRRTPLVVIDQSITDGFAGVSLNAKLEYVFDEQLSAECLDSTKFTLKEAGSDIAVMGSLALSDDRKTVHFTPEVNLSSSTAYTVSMAGLCDVAGNAMVNYSNTFTTSNALGSDETLPRLSEASPAANAKDISVESPVILTFTEAMSATGLEQLEVSANGVRLAGSYSVSADQTKVTFMPDTAYPADAEIRVYSYKLKDLAGNTLYINYTFTTESSSKDITQPVVIAITPNDNSVDLSIRSKVVLTFSESLDANTVDGTSVSLFGNGTRLNTSVSRSLDNKIITLSANLPSDSVIAVVATDAIKDLSGNTLQDYVALFTTGSSLDEQRPSIVTLKPGSGAYDVEPDSSIVLYSDEALNAGTLAEEGAFYVSQEGQLISGGLSLHGLGKIIVFKPDRPFESGGFIEVFANSRIQDLSGNALKSFHGSFRVKQLDGSAEDFALVDSGLRSGLPLNAKFYLRFNYEIDPISIGTDPDIPTDPVTVTDTDPANGFVRVTVTTTDFVAGTVTVTDPVTGDSYGHSSVAFSDPDSVVVSGYNGDEGHVLPSNVALEPDGKTISITPDDFWGANKIDSVNRVLVELHGITDINGNQLYGRALEFSFQEDAAKDSVAPQITLSRPESGSSDVAINSRLVVQFNEPINPLSFDLNAIFSGIPGSWEVAGDNKTFSYTPHGPLPSDTTVIAIFSGLEDYAGNVLPDTSVSFDTSDYADVKAPSVVAQMPSEYGEMAINSKIQVLFDEAIDPLSIGESGLFDYSNNYESVEAKASLGSDGRSLIIDPVEGLIANNRYYQYYSVRDMVGNKRSGYTDFSTGAVPDETSPEVVAVNVMDGQIDVPINTTLQVTFDEPVNSQTLGGVKLSSSGGGLVTYVRALSDDQKSVLLTVQKLLMSNASYTLSVEGVEDTAGNVLLKQVGRSFSTGAGAEW